MRQIFLVYFVFGFGILAAEASTLRVTCDDQAVGAEISIDDKYKGECPIDIQVTEGKYSLKAVKKINGKNAVFKNEVKIGDGVTKRIEVLFGAPQGAAAAAPTIRIDHNAVAQQRREIEMTEYKRSIQNCLPKFEVELSRLKEQIRSGYKRKYNDCLERYAERIEESTQGKAYIRQVTCGDPSWDGEDAFELTEYGYWIFFNMRQEGAQAWCEKKFTKPM